MLWRMCLHLRKMHPYFKRLNSDSSRTRFPYRPKQGVPNSQMKYAGEYCVSFIEVVNLLTFCLCTVLAHKFDCSEDFNDPFNFSQGEKRRESIQFQDDCNARSPLKHRGILYIMVFYTA